MQSDSAHHVKKRGSLLKKIAKTAGISLLVLAIFITGVGVGSGGVRFGLTPNAQNKDLPEDLDYSSIEELYDTLKANYDGSLDEQALLDGLKAGLAEATGDPYTQYFNAKEAEEFNAQLSGSFTGIGAELGEDKDGNLIIVSPIEGFPASKAGLRPQDIIVSIDGTSTSDMNISEAVTRIRGEKGTKVTLRILRNKNQDLSFTITRADIRIASVEWEVLPDNIGYLQINQFSDDTTALARRAADEFVGKKVKGVILDVRGNPGGLLTAAVEVSSLWLPSDKVVLQEKQSGVVVDTYNSLGGATLQGMPTVVLINAGSASASEIVAGALRDNKAAVLYGEKTFGKGSVQKINRLPGGAEVKITVARWYRPNGQNIDKKGIKPDKEVKRTDQDFEQDRDPQRDAAVQYLQSR